LPPNPKLGDIRQQQSKAGTKREDPLETVILKCYSCKRNRLKR
jgi:hypothetical protein